jgi:hypothetical protein
VDRQERAVLLDQQVLLDRLEQAERLVLQDKMVELDITSQQRLQILIQETG